MSDILSAKEAWEISNKSIPTTYLKRVDEGVRKAAAAGKLYTTLRGDWVGTCPESVIKELRNKGYDVIRSTNLYDEHCITLAWYQYMGERK